MSNKVAGARTRSGRGSGLSHSVSGRLALDGGWAGAAGGRVGAPVLEYGEGEHREVDAVEAWLGLGLGLGFEKLTQWKPG